MVYTYTIVYYTYQIVYYTYRIVYYTYQIVYYTYQIFYFAYQIILVVPIAAGRGLTAIAVGVFRKVLARGEDNIPFSRLVALKRTEYP